ncbi:hypothetical protein XdyCFBP7245_05905 [Xanthomonas dyei]|uniref:Uncharacterized protein n=1 Tax=Xanthomonas dyei TaxID=743699 RepID=A0A2S7C7U9_9XANT|nr:hypothetical protein XdyCFBP7245_05905 [Xanthomonas dyei]
MHPAYRHSRLALACRSSLDLTTRHGCRVSALQGRTCGVFRDGGRARALHPSRRSAALPAMHPYRRKDVVCDLLHRRLAK